MHPLLQNHLEPVLRDHNRWRLTCALAWGWAVSAVIGLVFILLHFATGWTSPWAFLLLFVAAAVWTVAAWWRTRRDAADHRFIARQIEANNPELHAVLLTAIEQTPDPTTGELNYLQERVVREALERDRLHGWHSQTLKRLTVSQFAGAASLVVLLGALLALYRITPPGAVLAQFKSPGVTVTPGDTTVEKGSSLVVLARFDGRLPSQAELVVRPANEPEQRLSLKKNLDDPVFGTSLPEVKGDLTYRIEYDGGHTRDFRVKTFEFPRLERADAKVTFPDYTGLTQKTIPNTHRISAVEGSALDYTFYLNKPVASAQLVTTDAPPVSLLGGTNHANVYATHLKLQSSRRYELILVDDAGRTNKMPPQFVFDVLTNRTPEMKFAFPSGDQRVSPLEEVSFQAQALDDFGLKAYGIAYNLAGKETKFVQLGKDAGANQRRTFNYLLPLEKLDAQPDQLLSYYLWADDIGPDGNVRRTAGDMYFAEVRPFDEIFRQGQSPAGGQQQQQQGQQQQNSAERLAELQKQIISATWNLQRRETGSSPSSGYKQDTTVVKDSQESALQQAESRRDRMNDPHSTALLDTVEKQMKEAASQLGDAADKNSVQPLPGALSAEQSAYQTLLSLAAHEYQVAQSRNGQSGQRNRGARAQRQLNQLDLTQSQNRYETQSEAAPPQTPQQREQLQAFNRLKELARRQQDINDRLKELQTALQEAKTEAERQELRDRLKRLEEQQRQLVSDMDELRQRMDRPENQSQMAEARQQLDQARSQAQNAADQMQPNSVAQSLASGTRAQRGLQQLKDDFRQQTSSQFANDMRELRNQARELAQNEERIGQQLDSLNDPSQQKTLTDSDQRKELASQLDQQKQRKDQLIEHATKITQQAETVEPLLAKKLYDTLRQADQDETRALQETTDDLMSQGRMYRGVYDTLQNAKDKSQRPVEVASQLLRDGFSPEAGQLEQRARTGINNLKRGVESAAKSVLGDDIQELQYAQRELDNLNQQLQNEIAQGRGRTNANANANGATGGSREGNRQPQNGNQNPNRNSNENQLASNSDQQNGQNQDQNGQSSGQNSQNAEQAQNAQSNQQRNGGGRNGQNGRQQNGNQSSQSQSQTQAQQQLASANGRGGSGGRNDNANNNANPDNNSPNSARSGSNRGGADNFYNRLGNNDGRGGGGGIWGGPITGPDYTQWSDRLRDVEELLDVPELRTEAARIQDRARQFRLDVKRHAKAPQWDLIEAQVAGPLVELRNRIGEELARRESKTALVPIDRDPVPDRYAELVQHYYENLGKGETGSGTEGGARQ